MDLDFIRNIEERCSNANVSIALDWLSMYFTHSSFFKDNMSEGDTQIINDNCYLLCIDRPTLHFNKHAVIVYNATEVAHVLYDSRNEKFFTKDTCKIEFVNHTLYSGVWQDIYHIMTDCGLIYKATSRIDIAIDGVGYLSDLLNFYAKQSRKNLICRLKNSSTIRARFSAKVLNPNTFKFENFNIGSGTGNKMITVYNKSLEILKSGKEYIQDYWKLNGVIYEIQDFTLMQKYIKEQERNGIDVVSVNSSGDIYRFELRLKSESIKEIENYDPTMLMTKSGLASIVKCHCKNYFEMILLDDENVSRCSLVNMLPYNRLEAKNIYKIPRFEKDGLYKAKMTIHGLVSDMYKGMVSKNNYNELIEMIMDRVGGYSLHDYLDRKLLEWHNRYIESVSEKRLNDVIIVINQIKSRNAQLHESIADLASRHNQANATAFFYD